MEGRICDTCRPGYWNIDRNNPNGCQGRHIVLVHCYIFPSYVHLFLTQLLCVINVMWMVVHVTRVEPFTGTLTAAIQMAV